MATVMRNFEHAVSRRAIFVYLIKEVVILVGSGRLYGLRSFYWRVQIQNIVIVFSSNEYVSLLFAKKQGNTFLFPIFPAFFNPSSSKTPF